MFQIRQSVGTAGHGPLTDTRRRYLLLDSGQVEAIQHADLVIGQVRKSAENPLFEEDKPWERRFDNLYANVIYDEEDRVYKCWYSPFIISHSSKGLSLDQRKLCVYGPHDQEMGICYATSEDGIHWDKPVLGLVEYDGSRQNNILWRDKITPDPDSPKFAWGGPHGAGIFKDVHDPDPARRYKALLKKEILSVAFSADGVHWGPAIPCPEANSHGDTHNNALWAPTLGEYVGITRQWSDPRGEFGKRVRQVARTRSADFLQWEKTSIVLEGLDEHQQIYSMPVCYHGGIYLGLAAIHDQRSDRVWTELTWSPDTETWHRVLPGTPLIGNDGEEGDYDWGCVYAAANPLFLDDEIRLYYGASDGLHTSWRNGFFCLATLRPDGFAGYRAVSGSVTTVALFNGSIGLRATADIEAGGTLIVRAVDERGQVVAESVPMTESGTDAEIEWQDKRIPATGGEPPLRLQFDLQNATVFSFVTG